MMMMAMTMTMMTMHRRPIVLLPEVAIHRHPDTFVWPEQ
jgi:hypothetical protein